MTLLCIQSHSGKPGVTFQQAAGRGDARVIRQPQLTRDHLAQARGLITTMHLDQIGLMGFAADLAAFLDRGGRWFFNGHMLREFVPGLGVYQPIPQAGREDLRLTPLAQHAVFAGIDRARLGARKGVAGFYGRGANPLPVGATAVTGVGPGRLPLDWDWARPEGGRLFSHAGNDLPGACEARADSQRLADNVIAWTLAEEPAP